MLLMQCPTGWHSLLVGSARGTRQSPFSSLHPWRMADHVLVIVMLLWLWTIAPLLPSWKMVTYSLSAKVPTLRSELDDNAGRMCVWHAGGRSCDIGSRADADVFAT